MQIKRKQIELAIDEDRDPWAVSDQLLHDLCKKYPDHRNAKAVTAKMLMIGRAYAATARLSNATRTHASGVLAPPQSG